LVEDRAKELKDKSLDEYGFVLDFIVIKTMSNIRIIFFAMDFETI